jgi:hypothetical protein
MSAPDGQIALAADSVAAAITGAVVDVAVLV